MPPVRFVYFDLDDTLLDHRHAERRALAELYAAHPELAGACTRRALHACYHEQNVVLWRQYARGEITKEQLQRRRFEHVLATFGIVGIDAARLGERYMAYYANHWRMIAGARAGFARIAGRLPVGILTNGFAQVQHAKMQRFPELYDRLSHFVVSEEVGFMKPNPQLFAHAAGRAGTPPETILYVGDSYESDVRGALDAGWQAAWFVPAGPPAEPPRGVLAFRRWTDLAALLAPPARRPAVGATTHRPGAPP